MDSKANWCSLSRLVPSAALVLLAANSWAYQPKKPPPKAQVHHSSKVTGLKSAPRSPARIAYQTNLAGYALGEFLLRYPSGDHKSRQLAVMPLGAVLDARLGDQDSKEPFQYRVVHNHVFVSTQPSVVSKSHCVDTCNLLYPATSDTVFVLSGFDLRREGGDDNVREITILPDDAGRIKVSYRDNQVPSRPFDVTLRYVLMPRAKVHGTYEAVGRNKRDKASNLFYDIDGKSVPANAVLRLPQQVKKLPGQIGVGAFVSDVYTTTVLRGFSVRFANGDHFIGAFGVVPGSRFEPYITVWFNDQNYDDPYDARVRYALTEPVI